MIDLDGPELDDGTIAGKYALGCAAVAAHFSGMPLVVGACVELDGATYVVEAVRVTCDGNVVHADGEPPLPRDPEHGRDYAPPTPVAVELWLRPATPGEC